MSITTAPSNNVLADFATGAQLLTDVFKAVLIKPTHTGTYDNNFTSAGTPGTGAPSATNIGTDEVSGTGYTSGGIPLGTPTLTSSGGYALLDFPDSTPLSGCTFSTIGFVIVNVTRGNKVVGCVNFGANQSPNNEAFTIDFPASGVSTSLFRIRILPAATVVTNAPGVYIPTGWGNKWKAKLANASTTRASVAWVGDSVTAGAWTSDLENKNFAGLVGNQLQAKYGDGGSGYLSSWRTDLILGNAGYTPAGRATLAGTWAANNTVLDGPGANHVRAGSAGATYTKVVRGTTVNIYLLSGTSASFGSYTVTIDGVSQGSAVSTNTGTAGIIRRSFTGLSAGNHTVVVTATDANGSSTYLFLCGVEGLNATGVVSHNYARGSYPSAVFNNVSGMSYVYTDGSTYGGTSVGTFGAAGLWSGGRKNPADLVIWGLGLNDSRFGVGGSTVVTPDAFAANLERFLLGVRDGDGAGNYDSRNPNTEIMILAMHAGSPAFQSGSVRNYAAYCEQMRAVAEVYGCAFINIWQAAGNNFKDWLDAGYFGTNANGSGGAGTDAVHLSDAGAQAVANIISPYIVL